MQAIILWWQSSSTAKSADAARDNARAALLAQRPFLVPGEIILAEPLAIGRQPRFTWQLQNSGATPAIGLGAFIGFNANGNPLPQTVSYGDETRQINEVIIGPKGPYHLPIDMPFPLTQERLALWQGGAELLFWVKIPYRDQFGEKHVVRTAIAYSVRDGRDRVPSNPDYFEST